MSINYQYKKGICVHCGRSLICGKGVAHFKCSYRAQEILEGIQAEAQAVRLSPTVQMTTIHALASSISRED